MRNKRNGKGKSIRAFGDHHVSSLGRGEQGSSYVEYSQLINGDLVRFEQLVEQWDTAVRSCARRPVRTATRTARASHRWSAANFNFDADDLDNK